MRFKKQFLIIGNMNAITYKEIFPLIKDNKIWLGITHAKEFIQPDGTKKKFGNVCWYTNLDYHARHEEMILYKEYHGHEEEYPKYDNYDAINVDKTSDIPCDYFENSCVPIVSSDGQIPGDSQSVNVERERESSVTESWAFRSHSLTSTTPTNSLSSDLPQETLEGLRASSQQQVKTVRISEENCATAESSSRERCSGIMGVPITFLDRYNPEQFEIVGITLGNTVEYNMTTIYINAVQYNLDGSTQSGSKVNTRAAIRVNNKPTDKVYYIAENANGYLISIYPRILIKRRQRNEN